MKYILNITDENHNHITTYTTTQDNEKDAIQYFGLTLLEDGENWE